MYDDEGNWHENPQITFLLVLILRFCQHKSNHSEFFIVVFLSFYSNTLSTRDALELIHVLVFPLPTRYRIVSTVVCSHYRLA